MLWSSFKKEKRKWFENPGHTLYRAHTHWKIIIAPVCAEWRERAKAKFALWYLGNRESLLGGSVKTVWSEWGGLDC